MGKKNVEVGLLKVKGWKGEKVKRWLRPFKGEKVKRWLRTTDEQAGLM